MNTENEISVDATELCDQEASSLEETPVSAESEVEAEVEGEVCDTPAVCEEACPKDMGNEALLLRISELELELQRALTQNAREREERDELLALFPDADPFALPDEVVKNHGAGVPLAAAYALYEKKRSLELERAQRSNEVNARTLHGCLSSNVENEFFSSDEVRSMSPTQVRENFQKILASMKQW